MRFLHVMALVALVLAPLSATAADYPAPMSGDWVAKNFRFHTGAVMDVRLHYVTVGDPKGIPVLVLHGTYGSGASMVNPAYAGQLFGRGQPLDAAKYFIILPDAIGTGGSTKPSDGMHARFPEYDYADMVSAQYRLVTEGLGIKHLRLVTGNSMGGMQTWMWAETYPDFMDVAVPMASQPTAMASRNWMMRRMIIDSVRNDPAWNHGEYTTEPPMFRVANVFFGIATSGGSIAYAAQAPTNAAADKLLNDRLAAPFPADANDFLYQWQSSADYDASGALGRIKARLLAINSADDERNPYDTGIMAREIKLVKYGKYMLIPASADTRGHGTTGFAKFYAQALGNLLKTAPYTATIQK